MVGLALSIESSFDLLKLEIISIKINLFTMFVCQFYKIQKVQIAGPS